jgi:hypothetical protein
MLRGKRKIGYDQRHAFFFHPWLQQSYKKETRMLTKMNRLEGRDSPHRFIAFHRRKKRSIIAFSISTIN